MLPYFFIAVIMPGRSYILAIYLHEMRQLAEEGIKADFPKADIYVKLLLMFLWQCICVMNPRGKGLQQKMILSLSLFFLFGKHTVCWYQKIGAVFDGQVEQATAKR